MPYIWVPNEDDFSNRVARIEWKIDKLARAENRMEIEMALDFTKMQAAAAKQADVTQSVLAYLGAQSTELTAIRQQLADAIAAGDPAAMAAAQKSLDDFAVGIDTNDDAIAAAIATPGPSTEPVPEPAPVVPVAPAEGSTVGGRRR